jgi:hypothetical protein
MEIQSYNENRMSILLRPDGLSFACCRSGQIHSETIRLPEENCQIGFEAVFFDPRWPAEAFAEVWVGVPTECALLIPAEIDCPEQYATLLTSFGWPVDPGARILADPIGEKVVLHGVCDDVFLPLSEKFGNRLNFFHPLTVSLLQPEEEGMVLRIDAVGGIGNYTLSRGRELLFADVFPLNNEASLLLTVNRIIVTGKIGVLRIVCSGEHCEDHCALLSRHYRNVSVHPDGENRNLFFPLSCA